eukprot:COSAG01_NODE_51805_length_351_cov_17.896825_2_plen_27_part_01
MAGCLAEELDGARPDGWGVGVWGCEA